MDIQRVLILVGLAATAYLLVLAWNEDYASDESVPTVLSDTGNGMAEVPLGSSPQETNLIPQVPVSPSNESRPASNGSDVPELTLTQRDIDQPAVQRSGRYIEVRTDVLEVTIDLNGGDIVAANLLAFPQSIDSELPFILIDPRNEYAAQSGLIGPNGIDGGASRAQYRTNQVFYELTGESLEVSLQATGSDPSVAIEKRFVFRRGDYLMDMSYYIDNQSTELWQGAIYAQLKRDGRDALMSDDVGIGMQSYTGGATFQSDTPYHKLSFGDLDDERYQSEETGGYMAMVQHYFLSAWVPDQTTQASYYARRKSGGDVYLFGLTLPLQQVLPGESSSQGVSLYVGPKDQYRLQDIAEGLDLTVDYGFLWWLAQPLFFLLYMIHGVVQNWGVAIILLTATVKLLLYPLSAAGFRSMAKLKRLQPQMTRLKERHGDDRQKFTEEMMALYRKEGADPIRGCLPLLLQMPVFLALFWTLMESVELRQAPFVGWITDLSAIDPYFVLPILMGISMYITTALQPEPPDPMQAKIFKIMPVMFTFFFLWFPAGLVLYWVVNNVLSILQQWYVNRQLEKESQ
ncbi:MAG: membrane protein insertase YidC [Gammaproteobacteria bacterium]|uniref:Membrane protein insertase YidC n=1 Tax=OM182 bacterium MED-G24 TaxID=1986255 RepID=A0A2A5WX70_9GAMM|nr:membrane protein insertase YidC [Gammaproteobacteria bacterium]PDH41145.1 MAG: membrane protein insertase YidC [OM182 bacterium MED-G24]RPG27318.1 MAG: membrane protein insertase YidC [Gammaproteobacteria bacterium TMED50]